MMGTRWRFSSLRRLVAWAVVWAHVRTNFGTDIRADIRAAVTHVRTTIVIARPPADMPPAAAVSIVLSPKGSEPLFLGMGVDVCADDEANNVEEGHPCVLGQELLGKGQRYGRNNPADLHDGPEACLDRSLDLVECAGASNECHGGQVDAVLDRRDLGESAGNGHTEDAVGEGGSQWHSQ